MNSIRPLVTITILAVVGAWLYVKINQQPAPSHDEATAWDDHQHDDVPPLASTATSSPAATAGAIAPPWQGATSGTLQSPAPATSTEPTPATLPPAAATASHVDLPAIPTLPDVSATPQSVPSMAATSVPVALPASIPIARYPDSSGTALNATIDVPTAAPTDIAESNAANFNADDVGDLPAAVPRPATSATAEHESTIATDNAMAAAGLTPRPPLTGTTATAGDPSAAPLDMTAADRYGPSSNAPVDQLPPAIADAPIEPTFAAAWPEIETALNRRELARAHRLLSKWYGDASLSPAETEKVNSLLGQLAGTVVYSTEHQLEPAYFVKPGDTLTTIAHEYNVPAQLLAKINGISPAGALQPGQSLKIVRGPFSAVVDLGRNELLLMLDDRYAGKFPIIVPASGNFADGEWLVEQKLTAPPSAGAIQTSTAAAPKTVDRAIILRGEDASTGKPATTGPMVIIASISPPAGAVPNTPAIRVTPQDAEELSDILSIGSRVTIRN